MRSIISAYTAEEREGIILEAILDLKAVDIDVRINEVKKSVAICIPFEPRKGAKVKEMVMTAVEFLNGFLPGQRVDASSAKQMGLTPRTAAGGTRQAHWKIIKERTFTFMSPVSQFSTRRKEEDKQRREFEIKQRHDERARAMIPKDGSELMQGMQSSSAASEDMGPPIVAYRDDLVENEDGIGEVEDFKGRWSLGALCCRKGAKCNMFSMFCARVMGKKANKEYTALYELCEKMQIIPDFTSRYLEWAAYNVKLPHSTPGLRLMVFGWQPTIDHMDFAGILNANALYSFTIGVPQLGFALWFLLMMQPEPPSAADLAAVANGTLVLPDDSSRNVVLFSTIMSAASIILSLCNICFNFPKHLRKIAEKKAEQARDHLDAMRSTQSTVQRLQEEAFNDKKHRFELAQNDDEGYKYYVPSRVLDDVMKVEWNLMVNEVDVMWQQMHRTQLKNKARKDAKEGVNPFKVAAQQQSEMLKRVPYYAGPQREYEYPGIEEFVKTGPLRTPKSSWTLRTRERALETLEPVPQPSSNHILTMSHQAMASPQGMADFPMPRRATSAEMAGGGESLSSSFDTRATYVVGGASDPVDRNDGIDRMSVPVWSTQKNLLSVGQPKFDPMTGQPIVSDSGDGTAAGEVVDDPPRA